MLEAILTFESKRSNGILYDDQIHEEQGDTYFQTSLSIISFSLTRHSARLMDDRLSSGNMSAKNGEDVSRFRYPFTWWMWAWEGRVSSVFALPTSPISCWKKTENCPVHLLHMISVVT